MARVMVTVAAGSSAGALAETVRPVPSLAVRNQVSGGSPSIVCATVNEWPLVWDGCTA